MATFLAETYLSRERASELDEIARRFHDLVPVRHLFSYFVAEDEIAFHCFEGPSPDAVRVAMARAGLEADRIVPASPIPGPRD